MTFHREKIDMVKKQYPVVSSQVEDYRVSFPQCRFGDDGSARGFFLFCLCTIQASLGVI